MRLLADVKDEGGKYISPGTGIEVRVTNIESFVSKKGNDTKDYELTDALGRTINVYLSMTDNALWKFKSFVCACGLKPDDVEKFDVDNQKHHNALVGRKIMIDVVKERRDGKEYSVVERWYSCAGETRQAQQEEQRKSIVDRLSAAAAAADEDVPF